jgi:CRP/FNR family cyclic AMP-dependent transcriptional regulator
LAPALLYSWRNFNLEETTMTNCLNCPQACKHPFCSLGEKSLSFLEANSIPMEYRRGNTLFREGDECSAVFVICSGRVKISATSREGRTFILRIAGSGDVLGMGAALQADDYEATAEAIEPTQVRVLRAKVFKQMVQEFADAGLGAARALAKDYRAAFDEACLIALPGSPAGKLARLILDWEADAKYRGPESSVTMPLTHEELASMTATTRETVTRTLGRFRKEKLITIRGAALTVLQPQALEQLSAC